MPYYQKLGEIPRKHHIWFHRNGAAPTFKNEGIAYEHVITTEGFNEAYSIMRSQLLVRIFSGAQNDVAAFEPGGKRAAVWAGYYTARTQLSMPAHVSGGTTRT